jgi:hypothetical protein
MNRLKKIFLFGILFIIALFLAKRITGEFFPSSDTINLWFYSGIVMILFSMFFIEPYYTAPTNAAANSVALLLLLVSIKKDLYATDAGIYWAVGIVYCLSILTLAWSSSIFKSEDKSSQTFLNKYSEIAKVIAVQFGSGKILYSGTLLFFIFYYHSVKNFNILLLLVFWAILLAIDPAKLADKLKINIIEKEDDVGEILGVQSKNTFLVKLYTDGPKVKLFDFVEFKYSMEEGKGAQKGLVVDNYLLNKEQWVKILATDDIQKLFVKNDEKTIKGENIVYKVRTEEKSKILEKFVGFIVDKSTISKIRFQFASQIEIAEGQLLEVYVSSKKVLYQVVQGITETELLESKNETGYIVGEAIQLGIWNSKESSFEKFGWVPDINTPVYLATDIENVAPACNEYVIGNIPNTNYPIIINKIDAITHHLGVLGVTGCGKSVFVRNLLREIIKDGTKVICVDFTNEYLGKLADLKPEAIVQTKDAEEIFHAIDFISLEMDKFPNQRNVTSISRSEGLIQEKLFESIKNFLQNKDLAIFELPDVSNTTGILEYTKWFFRVLFNIAKEQKSFGKRICIVLEEAHTVIPEWNFLGVNEKTSQSLVNSIGQIALQGRKYNIGFVVIAQRTANVSKTVLTQCNSMIAFQAFDQTSNEFLKNYLGKEMGETLPNLKFRQAIAVGKAFKSNVPLIFEVPEIKET